MHELDNKHIEEKAWSVGAFGNGKSSGSVRRVQSKRSLSSEGMSSSDKTRRCLRTSQNVRSLGSSRCVVSERNGRSGKRSWRSGSGSGSGRLGRKRLEDLGRRRRERRRERRRRSCGMVCFRPCWRVAALKLAAGNACEDRGGRYILYL